MTIDDELLLELIKPDSKGKIGKVALIKQIIGKEPIFYKLEHDENYTITIGTGSATTPEIVKMTPDIVVRTADAKVNMTFPVLVPPEEIAFEVENDIHWDFQESLRQVKKYKKRYPDTRVIIPLSFERFAPLYINEEIRVYLWNATRRWECLRCGTETEKVGPVNPKCHQCGNNSPNDFMLIGLKETRIDEYPQKSLLHGLS